jgi:hypothetical protein
MKKILLAVSILMISVSAFAQSEKYNTMMKSTIALMDSAKTKDDYMATANRFELIANKEKSQWLPFYYAAYCNQMTCYMGLKGEEIDAVCDKAEAAINKADSLQPNNSEIYVMKARVNGARIMVSPMSRGAKYGKISAGILMQAEAIDSLNPRIYLTRGQALFYTPKMFGGGKERAKPVLEKSMNCYSKYKPATELHPNWGLGFTGYLLGQCEEKK